MSKLEGVTLIKMILVIKKEIIIFVISFACKLKSNYSIACKSKFLSFYRKGADQ